MFSKTIKFLYISLKKLIFFLGNLKNFQRLRIPEIFIVSLINLLFYLIKENNFEFKKKTLNRCPFRI
jgi:hypothetical protein